MHKLEVLKNKIKSGIYLATNNRKNISKMIIYVFIIIMSSMIFMISLFLCKKYK